MVTVRPGHQGRKWIAEIGRAELVAAGKPQVSAPQPDPDGASYHPVGRNGRDSYDVARPVGDNGAVPPGKRAGSKQKRTLRPALLGLALGVTFSVVAWGYLVYAAVDFGADARDGDTTSWWYLGLASAGAVACLFLGLILLTRISRALGITGTPPPKAPKPPPRDPDLPPGGRRAAR